MPALGLSRSLPTMSLFGSAVVVPTDLPLSSSPITLTFSQTTTSSNGFSFSGANSLIRLNNNSWYSSGETPTSPGFYNGLGMAHQASWPETYGGFATGNSKWVVYAGWVDDGTPYMDIFYYHPTHPNTSIPISGWLLGSTFGTPTTGGTLTIS
jgi:hypothetical protein